MIETPLSTDPETSDRPFCSDPHWFDTVLRDSSRVRVIRATIKKPNGDTQDGMAIFASRRRGPMLVLTTAGAKRLADRLNAFLEKEITK